ncbi:MAG TPA: MFS transporter [Caulobacteraceae bacterium]|nr:MFS transporter [Caulobacteraceae bacterium]
MAGKWIERLKARAIAVAGGPARAQVIALLAAVLAMATADRGCISAVADQLKQAFSIDNTQFGLVLAAASFATAIGVLPMGVLVDRAARKSILAAAILAWTGAMVLSGAATSYLFLILTRILVGAVTAVAWPCVASLTGDFFPARERASVYGLILAGEFVGTGAGFFISGEVSAVLGWRWSFYAMAAISLGLAAALWRFLPEPARGGQGWLERGESDPGPRRGAGRQRRRRARGRPIRPRCAGSCTTGTSNPGPNSSCARIRRIAAGSGRSAIACACRAIAC